MARILYLVCPVCGVNRIYVRRGEEGNETAKWPGYEKTGPFAGRPFDIEDGIIMQVREGGGKQVIPGEDITGRGKAHGSGFHTVAGFTMQDLHDNPEMRAIVTQLYRELERIYLEMSAAGLV